ncbi:MAG: integrase, partial [Pseudomonadota bacterium]
IRPLAQIWEAAGYPWSVRLKALLPVWLPWLRKRMAISAETEQQLLAISARQIDRRLQPRKTDLRRRMYGRTKPGTLLKHHIPIKTDHWDVCSPGFTEIDLVSHSGDCAQGEFAHSFNVTDIHTAWTETRAVMGKGQTGIVAALEEMRQSLPFALRGIDSDNGSEFLNAHLVRYCQAQSIQFTRGRPYKKDDNAHIEQKNWTHVRKLIGWDRYDSTTAVSLLNDLYRHELRLMMNLFQPSVKLLRKERVGSRLKRVYDVPRTPLERWQAYPEAAAALVAKLTELRDTTDPFVLARTIDDKLARIYELASRHNHSNRVTSQTA